VLASLVVPPKLLVCPSVPNCSSTKILTLHQICSSQWTDSQQEEIQHIARTLVPGIETIAIPPGLNAAKGGEAVVDFLEEQVLKLGLPAHLDSMLMPRTWYIQIYIIYV
jgi:hypothetical protein